MCHLPARPPVLGRRAVSRASDSRAGDMVPAHPGRVGNVRLVLTCHRDTPWGALLTHTCPNVSTSCPSRPALGRAGLGGGHRRDSPCWPSLPDSPGHKSGLAQGLLPDGAAGVLPGRGHEMRPCLCPCL